MRTKLMGFALFFVTAVAVFFYPAIMAKTVSVPDEVGIELTQAEAPIVDVVFVLDTTGSMGGLIQTAKEKIWSIARTMASAQPTPEIRIGLVAYRDRGDEYVTKVIDLSSDLDAVYATLMQFEANGGGDGPESVNKALHDAVNAMSWSDESQAYRTIFLVGDAPPHMDYNEIRYPEIVAQADSLGIVINTIQCGDMPSTVQPWTQIANLGNGSYFQVEQAGGAVAVTTPFDDEIAELSARLDGTRLFYGSADEKAAIADKIERFASADAKASSAAKARRGAFNASAAGRKNLLGDRELVDGVASGKVDLDELDAEELPAVLKPMAPAEQKRYVAELAEERVQLQRQIAELDASRSEYIAKKVEAEGGADDSLDMNIYNAVKEQASDVGLVYEDGPAY